MNLRQAVDDTETQNEGAPSDFRLVTRWDLDKTYLRSEFYTLRDLLHTALERPDQKRAVPGAARLLREMSRSSTRVHILSGSPRQLQRSIRQRLALDGVTPDELTLKPNLRNILRFRFRALKDQLGYKLTSLLEAKQHELELLRMRGTPEVLFGDDSEADAFVYSLYADICSGNVDLAELESILEAGQTYPDLEKRALRAADGVKGKNAPEDFSILIHLDRQSPPSRFASFGKRLVPFFNYAQAALVLLEQERLSPLSVYGLGLEMIEQHRFEIDALARSYWDLHRRGYIGERAIERLEQARPQAPTPIAGWSQAIREADLRGAPSAPTSAPLPLDYQQLALEHRGGRDRH